MADTATTVSKLLAEWEEALAALEPSDPDYATKVEELNTQYTNKIEKYSTIAYEFKPGDVLTAGPLNDIVNQININTADITTNRLELDYKLMMLEKNTLNSSNITNEIAETTEDDNKIPTVGAIKDYSSPSNSTKQFKILDGTNEDKTVSFMADVNEGQTPGRIAIAKMDLLNSTRLSSSGTEDSKGTFRRGIIYLSEAVNNLYLQISVPTQIGDQQISSDTTIARKGTFTFIGDQNGKASISFGALMSTVGHRISKIKLLNTYGLWDLQCIGPINQDTRSSSVSLWTPYTGYGFGSLQVNADEGKSYSGELGPNEKIKAIEFFCQLPSDGSGDASTSNQGRANPEIYLVAMGC